MAVALLAVALVLRLWDASLRVPLSLRDDNPLTLSAIKGVIDNGWYFTNPSLGVPGGQDLIDFAGLTAENLPWAVIKVLGYVLPSAVVLGNVYFLAGFPVIAGVTYLLLRQFTASRPASLVGALLFALLPYHFWQGEVGHLQLATYVAVPLGGWFVIRALLGQPMFRRDQRPGGGWRSWITWPNACVLIAVIVVGGSTLYYAVFTLLLLMLAAPIRALVARSWRGLLPAIGSIAGIGIVLVLNLLPALVHRASAGPNTGLATRLPNQSEIFSFSFIQLILPISGHRLDVLSRAHDRWAEGTIIHGEGGIALGIVLAVAFIASLVMLCVWMLRGVVTRFPDPGRAGAVAVLIAFLVGTFGGISSIVAFFATPQLRVWSRLTPFVAFFCVVVLVLGLDALRRWIGRRSGRALPGAIVMALVAVIGVLDQTSAANVPAYAAVTADWNSRADFVHRVDDALPAGSAVLQLPLQQFPETAGIGAMGFYDHAVPYLLSDDLTWSYGAIKGRPEDWTDEAAVLPTSELIRAAAAAGFSGVYLDRAGAPQQAEEISEALRADGLPSGPELTARDQRLAYYSLAGLRQTLVESEGPARVDALGRALVTPVSVTYGSAFYGPEADTADRWIWARRRAEAVLDNPTGDVQRMRFTVTIESAPGSTVTMVYRGRVTMQVVPATGSVGIDTVLVVPPGRSAMSFTTTSPDIGSPADPRDLRMRFVNPAVKNLVFETG